MPVITPRQLYAPGGYRRVYGGSVAGIVIACVVCVIGFFFLIFCLLALRRRRNRRLAMNLNGPPNGTQYRPPYQGPPPPPPRYSGVSGRLSSLFPGGKGYYSGGSGGQGMTEAGQGQQQYDVQPGGHPNGYPEGGQPDEGITQPPPAYSR